MTGRLLARLVGVLGLCGLIGCAEMSGGPMADQLLASLQGAPGGALDEPTVAAGLKEALRVGSARAVGSTSRLDGFLANELIRIAMPEQLAPMAKTLRTIGLGSQVDQFEVAMNRSAEMAAGEAKAVFWDAIGQMTLADAHGILNGGDTAATEYFRSRTADTLRSRFKPIVAQKMGEVGLYQQYNQLSASYNALPFVTTPAVSIDDYVTGKGLDGLFTVLGQEEQAIRRDPAARTSELLQKVFSR
ncbi:hypothetical protein DESUT3_14410 [Desulfuromonas versatilis]|uniref:DUF4197 domain-containing protein n=1 Tax=Desulfuromonas versatilis TaxID=2802975 RepID=A0ABM8HUH0_9BACT|nr:DUF4197 domain-containing protein [Desulfuromonas versatilis]BCR04372.1 hypothetical protein DESUT3_14410 [Desulfuromonas versatilis]